MKNNPYKPPNTKFENTSLSFGFTDYDQVPVYRRQWFFWLFWFLFSPVSILILLTGDVYYPKKGEIKSFGIANRIVAGIFGIIWIFNILSQF